MTFKLAYLLKGAAVHAYVIVSKANDGSDANDITG